MTNTTEMNRKPKLEEVLKTLNEQGSVDFNGTLILGEIMGDLLEGGFLEPEQKYTGNMKVVKKQSCYGFQFADGTESADILTDRRWVLYRDSQPYYSKELRRDLKGVAHLSIHTHNPHQRNYFAILHHNREHQ